MKVAGLVERFLEPDDELLDRIKTQVEQYIPTFLDALRKGAKANAVTRLNSRTMTAKSTRTKKRKAVEEDVVEEDAAAMLRRAKQTVAKGKKYWNNRLSIL